MIFLLKIKGSKREAKKAPVDIIANVIETLETFIAEKNASQCNAINSPTKHNFKSVFKVTFKCTFFTIINKLKRFKPKL